MNQICNKCSEYASICVHMADEREAEEHREEMLKKYCTYHKFYNAWDL